MMANEVVSEIFLAHCALAIGFMEAFHSQVSPVLRCKIFAVTVCDFLGTFAFDSHSWWVITDLNRGPTGYEPVALTN